MYYCIRAEGVVMQLFYQMKYNLIIILGVWVAWLFYLGFDDAILTIMENWQITVTMVFGSFIAGATSEGGGAVAFPVFTKVLGINPVDAKMFSLAIQSVGMTAASLVIILNKIKVEWRVIKWVSMGGVLGITLGLSTFANQLPPGFTKIIFTVVVSSFAVVLAILNLRKRELHMALPVSGNTEMKILFVTGILGGVVSSLVGTGIDIFAFIIMVLLFRVSEKVATPTSVILMAIISLYGFALQSLVFGGVSVEVHDYWMAAIPVVVIGAPLGAIVCAKINRAAIAWFLIFLISIEFISSIIIIPMHGELVLFALMTFIICMAIYYRMLKISKYAYGNVLN